MIRRRVGGWHMPCNLPSQRRFFERRHMRAAKLIALLLPDSMQNLSNDDTDMDSATALMRDDDGRMSLRPLTQEMTRDLPFKEQVMTTGCFKRGKPIVDPS